MDQNQIAGKDLDKNINMGLFSYPILMAADILAFDCSIVPVGFDQKQHVEIARDIAESFNHIYGDIFVVPEPLIQESVQTIPGIDGRKMSKNYQNVIPLFASKKDRKKAVMQIATDSSSLEDPKDPGVLYSVCVIFIIC